MMHTILYSRRFFPYYCFVLVGGLDKDGVGALYGYDAIGSYERILSGAQGSGNTLVMSFLDNQVHFKTHPHNKKDLNCDEALELIKSTMTSVTERDISTGDKCEIMIVTANGIK